MPRLRWRALLLAGLLIAGESLAIAGAGAWWYVAKDPLALPVYQHVAGHDRAFEFHGLVRDESDLPVAGARVTLHVERANWWHVLGADKSTTSSTRSLTTDAGGRFVARGFWGHDLVVASIEKSGHQWVADINGQFENRSYVLGGNIIMPNEANPAVFPLHRGKAKTAKVSIGGGLSYDGKQSMNLVKEFPIP